MARIEFGAGFNELMPRSLLHETLFSALYKRLNAIVFRFASN